MSKVFQLSCALCVALGVQADDGVNSRIAPGDDFFAYANGAWLASTTIPDDKGKWSAANEIAATAASQLARVIHDGGKPGASPQARKVFDFYAAYMDGPGIEQRGLKPLATMLKEIEAIRDKTSLSHYLGSRLRADVDPLNLGVYDSPNLFGLAVCFGIHGETQHFAYLTQGGLGLNNREGYLSESKKGLRLVYRDYIGVVLESLGEDRPGERADAVLALETALARVHATAADSSKDSNADNHWARGQFMLDAPGIDWTAFFAAAGLIRQQDIVVWQPDAIKGTAALVASQPLEVWRDYLRFHLVHRHADVLPQAIAASAREVRVAQDPKARGMRREQAAIEATNRAMPSTVGRLYAAQYFPPASKARAQAILQNVVAVFRKRIETEAWMTPASRRRAVAKLNTMRFEVGYPEQWIDDAKAAIDPRDPVGNTERVEEWKYREALAKLPRAVDRREWVIAPQWPGAVLNFQLNSYNFAAALLQPPKFDPSASDAAAYGAIGAIFAHEVIHFVDALGADYDIEGAARNWWTAEDKAGYEAATRPLVAQYSAYRPLPDAAVDGQRTLVENVADLGGLSVAFDAYRAAVGSKAANREELRRMDRDFFIAYARGWRAALRDDALRTTLKGDSHAPERYRIATVRNLDAWYDAFDVRPGHLLYLPPAERVRVW
jgi:predicted metalloendopeptidase